MSHTCIIPDCTSEDDDINFFNFPKDSKMLDRWIQQLPMINFADIDFKEAVICESHFNPKDIFEDIESRKILVKNAVPENFDQIDEIGTEFSCRFCLKRIDDNKIEIDALIKSYYHNLMQDDLDPNIPLTLSCANCFNAIRNSSFIRKKIQENQSKLASLFEEDAEDFLEIKEELYESNDDIEAHFMLDTSDIKKEKRDADYDDDDDEDFEPKPKKAKPAPKPKQTKTEPVMKTKKVYVKRDKGDATEKPLGISRQREGHCEICDKFFGNIYRHKQRNHKQQLIEEKQLINLERKRKSGNVKAESDDSKSIVYLNDTETLEFEVVDGEDVKVEYNEPVVEKREYCKKCQCFFTNLAKHEFRVHEDVECDFCGSKHVGKLELEKHMKEAHQEYVAENFFCEICSKDFQSKYTYRSHINKVHLKKGLCYCEYCGREFGNKEVYQSHVRSKHTGERPFQCDQCSTSFSMKKSLKNHHARVHSTEQVECPFCGQVFTSDLGLKSHIKRTHAEKKFICDFEGCDQKFAESYRLKLHIKYTHLGIKDHECQICNKGFKNKDKLKRHILQVHSAVKYNCEVKKCNTQWPTRDAYKNHVVKRHLELGEDYVQHLLDKITNMEVPIVKKNIEFLECFEVAENTNEVTEYEEIQEVENSQDVQEIQEDSQEVVDGQENEDSQEVYESQEENEEIQEIHEIEQLEGEEIVE